MRKFVYLFIVIVTAILIIFLTGYRLSPLAAARAHFDVMENVETVEQVKLSWGTVFIFREEEYRRTVLVEPQAFLWRARAATHFDNIDDQEDNIKTIGSIIYKGKRGQVTLLAVESTDANVSAIEAGPETDRRNKNIKPGEIVIFTWDEALFFHELTPVALSKGGESLYIYGYPEETGIISIDELKWRSIQE